MPSSDKSPFSELITKHAVEVDFRPFIAVEGVTLKEFRKQRVEILDHTAVIFTSRTAIDHFFRICEECRLAVPEALKYFCVTEAIALYLQKYIVYRKRKIFFGTGTFLALMDVVIKHKDEKYLVPLSEPHKPEIPFSLTKAGIKFNKVILSHTVSADLKDVDIDDYSILAIYSPSEVKSLQANFPNSTGDCKIAVFGNNTARAALEAGISVDIMAPTPKMPSMTMAIDKYISNIKAGESVEELALRTMPEPTSLGKGVEKLAKKSRKVIAASTSERTRVTK